MFVHVPKHGYVGVGIVEGPARPANEAVLTHGGISQPFRSLDLIGDYGDLAAEESLDSSEEGGDTAEYIVPVTWIRTQALEDAFWRQGLFANQQSACRLRNQFTIDEVSKRFELDDVKVADLG